MTDSVSSESTDGTLPQHANPWRASTLAAQRASLEDDSVNYPVDLRGHSKWLAFASTREDRKRLKGMLETSGTLFFLEALNTCLSVLSVAIYITETYFDDTNGPNSLGYVVSAHVKESLEETDLVINIFFSLDLILRMMLAHSWVQFFFSWQFLVDLVTIFPVYARLIILAVEQSRTSGSDNQGYFSVSAKLNFFRIAKVIRIIRLLKLTNAIGHTAKNELQRQIFTEALVLLTLIFVFAGLFQVCENELVDAEKMYDRWGRHKLYFHDAVYFAIITISTVGYGDIYPISIPAKVIVVLGVVSSIAVISKQTNQLFTLLNVQSEFARNVYIPKTARTHHVVVCGHISYDSARTLLTEFFHEDHGQLDTKMVFLCPDRPSFELLFLLRSAEYSTRTVYLEGSAFVEEDLMRAGCMRCQCVFVLSDKFTRDPKAEDFSTIMHAMAVRDFIKKSCMLEEVHIIMQLIRPENRHHFQSSIYGKAWLTQLVCVDEIKLHVIAKSCLVPGFTSFVSNLIRSSSSDIPENADEWLKDYAQGCDNEIYRTVLSPNFCGKTFGECASIIYKDLKCTLFAIEIVDQARQTRVVLNPATYQIPHKRATYAFVIADDQDAADRVSSWPDGTATPMRESDESAERSRDGSAERSVEERGHESPLQVANPGGRSVNSPHSHSQSPGRDRRAHKSTVQSPGQASSSMPMPSIRDAWLHSLHTELSQMDLRRFMTQFHCLEVPAKLSDVTIDVSAPPDTLHGHVMVCGNVSALHHFVSTLRPKYLKKMRPIVIVHPGLEEESLEWRCVRYFTEIYYVNGTPLNNADLLRAGVKNLHTAVILSHEQDTQTENADADNVLTYHMIKKYNSYCKCVVEIMNPDNVNFMDRMQYEQSKGLRDDSASWRAIQTWRSKDPMFQPAYAAGIVYMDSVMDTLSCQCFFNIHLLTIIKQLVGTTDNSDAQFDQTVHASELYCIRCPTALVGRTYGQVFHYLVTHMNSVPLGLYRDPPANPSPAAPKTAYVISNPKATLRMSPTDCIYALRNPYDENDIVNNDLPAEVESEEAKPERLTLKSLSKRLLSGAEAGLEAGASALARSFSGKRRASLKAKKEENHGKHQGQQILKDLDAGAFRRTGNSPEARRLGKCNTMGSPQIAEAQATVDQIPDRFFRRGSDSVVVMSPSRLYSDANHWGLPVIEGSVDNPAFSGSSALGEMSEMYSIASWQQSPVPIYRRLSPGVTGEAMVGATALTVSPGYRHSNGSFSSEAVGPQSSEAAGVADEYKDPPAAGAGAAHRTLRLDASIEQHQPADVAASREPLLLPSPVSLQPGDALTRFLDPHHVNGSASTVGGAKGGSEGEHIVDLQSSGDVDKGTNTGPDGASS